jgi:glucosamine--fructose-6-phosphate aminotransferase (isomerizing)
MIALMLGKKREVLSDDVFRELVRELNKIPDKIEQILKRNDEIRDIASLYKNVTNCLYLGRGYFFPVALEGALKLKEISYIHAEGYPAAEMKHGPKMPVVFIATQDKSYDKIVSNIQEVKARSGIIIAIVTEGDTIIKGMADHTIEVPNSHEALTALLAVIPLQILSYHIAVMRGCNVDQPRNLAKSVTVE